MVLLFSGLTGCTTETIDQQIVQDSLVWAVLAPENIDPINITDENYYILIPNLLDGLVAFDENFRIIPALAVSWNNPDNLTWRFNLRQGVKFHNGADFTAEDVRYSMENNPSYTKIIQEITVLDNYTIEFKTFTPNPVFLSRLARGTIRCKNVTEPQVGRKLIGTGPYRILDYDTNYTTLERFDDYWGPRPQIKTVAFKVIEDNNARLDALISGDVDIAEYNIDNKIDEIKANKNITIVEFPPLSIYTIGFDLRENQSYSYPDGKNPTADLRVRKAIYQAINISPLINGPFKGLAQPESQLVSQYIFGYNPAIKRLPYNLTAARELLAEAGYEQGFDIVMDCITEGYDYNAENCYLITQQLAQVGIHVTMNNLSMIEYDEKVVAKRNTSMWLVGWGIDSMDGGLPYDWFIRSINGTLGILNSGYYSNAEVDRLGIAASEEMNSQERCLLLQEGFRIALVDDVAVIPLFSQDLLSLTATDVYLPPRADLRMVVKDIRFI